MERALMVLAAITGTAWVIGGVLIAAVIAGWI